jgi:hypothetical protein
MIRSIVRVAGFALTAAAFAALVVDGSRSIAGGRLLQYSLRDTLAWLAGARFDALLQVVATWPGAAQRPALVLLAVPGWIALGAAGLALLAAGRPRRRDVLFSERQR